MKSATIPFALKAMRGFFAYASWAVPSLAVRLLWQNLFSPPRRATNDTHRAFLASAEPLSLGSHLAIPSAKVLVLRGYRWGSGERTVLLIHGWGGNAGDFRSLVPLLVEAGFAVVALDLPAHGTSAGEESNLLDMREALVAWVAQFGWPYAIVAHSLGGIAASLLLEHTAESVEKFALVGVPIRAESGFDVGFEQLAVPVCIQARFYEEFERWLGYPVAYFALAHRRYLRARRILAVYDTTDEVVPITEVQTYLTAYPDIEQYWVSDVGHYRMFRSEAVRQCLLHFLSN